MIAPGVADPAGESFLAASKDRVGFYSARASAYVELSLSGDVLGVWKTTPPPRIIITGIAVTPSGAVFLSAHRQYKSGEATPEWQLPLYRLDKSSSALVQLPQDALSIPDGPIRPMLLLGTDGDELVFYSKPPASLSWFAVR
ncbi:MAG TPA: hypothetical protein VEU62_03375 [Bryobacterales bacterium]|nr:hypothetical protein [Bryobacterales bacterium]